MLIPKYLKAQDYIPFLNRKRAWLIFFFVFFIVWMSVFYIGFFVFILLGILLFSDWVGLFIGLAFLSMALAALSSVAFILCIARYKRYFFSCLLPFLAHRYYEDFEWDYNKFIPKKTIAKQAVFTKYKEFSPGCYYKGKIKSIPFESSYYEYVGLKKWISTKKGRIILFRLPIEQNDSFLLEDKDTKVLFKKNHLTEVKTESIAFNKEYRIFTNDDVEIFKQLTPNFIKKTNEFTDQYRCDLNLFFHKNYIYAAVNDYQNRFEFKLLRHVDAVYIDQFMDEVLMVYRLSDVLDIGKYATGINQKD